MIILDTSAVLDFLRGGERTRSIVEKAEASKQAIGVTTVSLFELLTPTYHRRMEKEEKAIRTFLRQCQLLGLDEPSAEEASKIMGRLFRLGMPVNALDALISGTAISNGADSIVTLDRDFQRISEIANVQVQLI